MAKGKNRYERGAKGGNCVPEGSCSHEACRRPVTAASCQADACGREGLPFERLAARTQKHTSTRLMPDHDMALQASKEKKKRCNNYRLLCVCLFVSPRCLSLSLPPSLSISLSLFSISVSFSPQALSLSLFLLYVSVCLSVCPLSVSASVSLSLSLLSLPLFLWLSLCLCPSAQLYLFLAISPPRVQSYQRFSLLSTKEVRV